MLMLTSLHATCNLCSAACNFSGAACDFSTQRCLRLFQRCLRLFWLLNMKLLPLPFVVLPPELNCQVSLHFSPVPTIQELGLCTQSVDAFCSLLIREVCYAAAGDMQLPLRWRQWRWGIS